MTGGAAQPERGSTDRLGWAALALGCLSSLAFFAGRWALNARGMGGRDLGLSLGLAVVVSITIYLSIALSVLDAALLLAALLRRRKRSIYFWALAVSLLPAGFLALRDAVR